MCPFPPMLPRASSSHKWNKSPAAGENCRDQLWKHQNNHSLLPLTLPLVTSKGHWQEGHLQAKILSLRSTFHRFLMFTNTYYTAALYCKINNSWVIPLRQSQSVGHSGKCEQIILTQWKCKNRGKHKAHSFNIYSPSTSQMAEPARTLRDMH